MSHTHKLCCKIQSFPKANVQQILGTHQSQ